MGPHLCPLFCNSPGGGRLGGVNYFTADLSDLIIVFDDLLPVYLYGYLFHPSECETSPEVPCRRSFLRQRHEKCETICRQSWYIHRLISYTQIEVVAAAPGKCSCEVKLEEFHLNRGGTLHGGFTATLVDSISTVAIMCAEKPPGVSVDMNVT